MKRTFGAWAVNSWRTTTTIELISDSKRTHHRKDRWRRSRTAGNCTRWPVLVAYNIDTPGKQPREPDVNFGGLARSTPRVGCVPRSRSGAAHYIRAAPGPIET